MTFPFKGNSRDQPVSELQKDARKSFFVVSGVSAVAEDTCRAKARGAYAMNPRVAVVENGMYVVFKCHCKLWALRM